MSYILDALRRADAERERGAVPSLHTQQYGAMQGDDDEAQRRSRLPALLAAVFALALLAIAGWHFLGGDTPRAPATTVASVPAPLAAPAPAPASAPALSTAPALATVPSATPATAPAPVLAPPSASTTPPTLASPTPTTRVAPAKVPATRSTPSEARPSPVRGPAASGATSDDRIYAMADLPDEVRRDLPKLAFGGASYSADPGSRMVILDGQVFHEGDSVARGVVLQRVNRKSAVLAVRGYRFELTF